MNPTGPDSVLVGTFPDRDGAAHFIAGLRRAGFRNDQIGLATPGEALTTVPGEEEPADHVAGSALTGALTGGTVGVIAGLALAAGLIPGVGPILAGGLLAGAAGGAALGATAGELLGSLAGMDATEEEGHDHEELLRAGRTVVVVHTRGRRDEALALLGRCGGEQAPTRAVPDGSELSE